MSNNNNNEIITYIRREHVRYVKYSVCGRCGVISAVDKFVVSCTTYCCHYYYSAGGFEKRKEDENKKKNCSR